MNAFAAPGARAERRREVVRYGAMLGLSLVLHLLLGLVVVLFGVEPPALAEEQELLVPLELEAPPPPPPAPPESLPEPPAEERDDDRRVPDDASLLGFRSEGTIKARPDRPVGPEAEIHGATPAGGGTEGVPEPVDPRRPPELQKQEVEPAADEPAAMAERPSPPSPEPVPPVPEPPPSGETVEDPLRVDEAPQRGGPEPLLPPREPPRAAPRPSPRPVPVRPPGPGDSSLDFDVGVRGGMFGNLDFDSPDYNWSEYSTKVYFAVYRAWLRELRNRARRFEREQKLDGHARLEGEVAIHFVINRDGSVSDLSIVSPAVLTNLDEASSAALLRAVLPQLPPDFPRDREGVTFRFILSVDSALQMERILNYRRSRGEF